MEKKKVKEIIYVFRAARDLVYASYDKDEAARGLERLAGTGDICEVVPVGVLDKIPDKIFISITLTKNKGEVDAVNFWFKDWPYDEDYIFIDDESFEVGVLAETVDAAIDIARVQWEIYKPVDGADWPSGELPLADPL